jgi:AraC-like DNA-binding protein
MNLVFSTAEFPVDDRLHALHEAVAEEFLPLRVLPMGRGSAALGFEGRLMARELDGLKVARFSGSSLSAVRDTCHIDASTSDDYLVALHVRGVARATQGGREIVLRPGDLALLDSTRPYSMELLNAGPFEHLAYRVPRPALDGRMNDVRSTVAVAVRAGSDAGGLASRHLCALASPTWRTPLAQSTTFVETGLDLLAAALRAAAGLSVAATSQHTDLLASARRYTLAHLGDPGLSPMSVAGALYISPRQLHRLFAQQEMTFAAWLREQRLQRCRRDLADERLQEQSISQIAMRWGYRSSAHFTRCFSARFGIGPRHFRRAAR